MQNHAICIEGTKLTISSMTPELGGQYLCIATNKYGQAITRSTIAVRGTIPGWLQHGVMLCVVN